MVCVCGWVWVGWVGGWGGEGVGLGGGGGGRPERVASACRQLLGRIMADKGCALPAVLCCMAFRPLQQQRWALPQPRCQSNASPSRHALSRGVTRPCVAPLLAPRPSDNPRLARPHMQTASGRRRCRTARCAAGCRLGPGPAAGTPPAPGAPPPLPGGASRPGRLARRSPARAPLQGGVDLPPSFVPSFPVSSCQHRPAACSCAGNRPLAGPP